METRLVRLKAGEARRGYVLRRFTYKGIKFVPERGWYRVAKAIADYLETVRHVSGDDHSPLAFDVCTEEEAKALEERETAQERPALVADAVRVAEARREQKAADEEDKSGGKGAGRRAKAAP